MTRSGKDKCRDRDHAMHPIALRPEYVACWPVLYAATKSCHINRIQWLRLGPEVPWLKIHRRLEVCRTGVAAAHSSPATSSRDGGATDLHRRDPRPGFPSWHTCQHR